MLDLLELFVQKDLLYQLVLCVAVLKNSCPNSTGFSVQIQMEWVSEMKWNHCPDSRGIGVQNALEYAVRFPLLMAYLI